MPHPQTPLGDYLNQTPQGQPQLGRTDEDMLLQMFLQQQQHPQRPERAPLSPRTLLALCGMGLGSLVTVAVMFVAWINRPVVELAHAGAIRALSDQSFAHQAQIAAVVEAAQPPQYNCVSLLGCNFPDAPRRDSATVLASQPVQPVQMIQPVQPVQPVQPAPARAYAMPVANAATPPIDADARRIFEEWESQGYDALMIGEIVRGQYVAPTPGLPTPEVLTAAYKGIYGG